MVKIESIDSYLNNVKNLVLSGEGIADEMCRLGTFCRTHGEPVAVNECSERGPMAQATATVLMDVPVSFMMDTIMEATRYGSELCRKVCDGEISNALRLEREELEGFMWCLEAMFGPRETFDLSLPIEFSNLLEDIDLEVSTRPLDDIEPPMTEAPERKVLEQIYESSPFNALLPWWALPAIVPDVDNDTIPGHGHSFVG